MEAVFLTARAATFALLAALLVAAPAACAQRGPQPGMTPEEYAVAYVQGQAAAAQNDTVGHAGRAASPEGVANATAEAAYIVCWLADDASDGAAHAVDGAVCDAFYTPPGSFEPPSSSDAGGNATDAVEDFAANATQAAREHQNATQAFLNRTLADPGSAPEGVEGFLNATAGFVRAVVRGAVQLVAALVGAVADAVQGVLGSLHVGLGAAGSGLLAASSGLVQGGQALAGGVASAGSAAVDAARSLAAAVGSAVGGLAQALQEGVVGLASAVGQGMAGGADGLAAAGKAVADAAVAVGSAVGSAAQDFVAAVSGLFGAPPSGEAGGGRLPGGGQGLGEGVDGVLDEVAGRLPL